VNVAEGVGVFVAEIAEVFAVTAEGVAVGIAVRGVADTAERVSAGNWSEGYHHKIRCNHPHDK
jgi:hypothetical protein